MSRHDKRRPELLGDRAQTRQIATRYGRYAFAGAILVLTPLALGVLTAARGPTASLLPGDVALAGLIVVALAFAIALATTVGVMMLGREARARRDR